MTDEELAAWARNWHWNDTAADQPVDPSIYFRDMRLLRAFILKFGPATYTDVCMNEKCPRGGMPLEVIRRHVSSPSGSGK